MNIGKCKDRIDILSLAKLENAYDWKVSGTAWAKSEKQSRTNLFSKVGIGVQTIVFVMRKQDLTLHNAIKLCGVHCFLTDIKELDQMYYEVMAAMIDPVYCKYTQVAEKTDEYNNPILQKPVEISFPACIVEKYLGWNQERPQAVNDISYVLVTPKEIELESGSSVTIYDERYHITVRHTLDSYKNEYEITQRKDV